MTDEPIFTEDKLNRLVTIKTIGWTMLIVVGLVIYSLVWDIASLTILRNPAQDFLENSTMDEHAELNDVFRNMRLAIYGACAVAALLFVCAVGMLNLKKWALIFFHAVSLVAIVIVFGLVIYSALNASPLESDPNNITIDEHFQYIQRLNLIQYGVSL